MFFNFYKKGNVVKVFEILDIKTEYSYNVPDNFLPKGFGNYDSFIIGELFTRDNQTKTSLTISDNKGLRITDYRDSIASLKYNGFYGEIFVGEYFTN